MPKKLGNGGNSLEEYSSETGKYISDGEPNKYYDNPKENVKLSSIRDYMQSNNDDDIEFNEDEFNDINSDNIDEILFGEKSNVDVVNTIQQKTNYEDNFETLYNYPGIDKEKIYGLSEERLKDVLSAILTLEDKRKDMQELNKLNSRKFYDMQSWESLSPSDYISLEKENLINSKMEYYKYKGVEQLKGFLGYIESGKQYKNKLEEINEKYKNSQQIIDEFFTNDNYSDMRKNNAIWCKSTEESEKVFGSQQMINNQKFTYFEEKAITDYTISSTVNYYLREIDSRAPSGQEHVKEMLNQASKVSSALDKSTFDQDIWVQRGIRELGDNKLGFLINEDTTEEELEKLVGTTYKDQGFLSCGAAKSTGFVDKPIMMNVYCPKGTKMAYITDISDFGDSENEMLIQRGYSYTIKKAYKQNGQIFVDVDVLLGTDDDKYNEDQINELFEKSYKKYGKK